MTFLHTTWADIQRNCEIIADQVKKADYHPDMIVAVSRGGFPPARILCDLLDVQVLASIGIEHYTSVKETKKSARIIFPLNADVRGKKVLIVDDVADTGHSLIRARDHVREKGASDLRIATLHYKPWSVFRPDFYGEVTDAWIVYVWEIRETIKQLVSKFRDEGKNDEEVKKQLLSLGFRDILGKAFII